MTLNNLKRVLEDGSLKRRLVAEGAARGEKWNEGEWRYCLQLFGFSYCEPDPPEDRDARAEWQMMVDRGWIVLDGPEHA